MKKFMRIVIIILTFLALVFGTIEIARMSNKIIVTSAKLVILNDNAQFYNEQPRKTDAMTESYLENDALRQEIYNSEDDLVRIFSNQHALVKAVILLLALAMYPLLLLVWIRQIYMVTYKFRKYLNIRRKMKLQKLRKAS